MSAGKTETEQHFSPLCPTTALLLAALKHLELLPELDGNTAL